MQALVELARRIYTMMVACMFSAVTISRRVRVVDHHIYICENQNQNRENTEQPPLRKSIFGVAFPVVKHCHYLGGAGLFRIAVRVVRVINRAHYFN